MKKVYYHHIMVGLDNDKEFSPMSFGGLVYKDEEKTSPKVIPYLTFEELWDAVQKGNIIHADARHTIFRKRRYVAIGTMYGRIVVFEDKFEPVFVKHIYNPVPTSISLESLMRQLPAEDFIDYIKSKGVDINGLIGR